MCAQPKYIEIFEWIKQQIDIGSLKPGERMYSEKELVELFSVSRQTVRHAISKLEYEDIVIKRRGSGTYIRKADRGAEPPGSMQIAVVTTYVDDYIFPRIIQEIQHTIAREGYMMQLMFTNNSVEKEREILNQLIEENNVAGIIIEPTRSALPNPNIPLFKKLADRRVPVVFLNSYYPQLEVPRVVLDDTLAGKLAAKHLISKGHKNIGAIFKSDDGQGLLRYYGYVEALLEAGLSFRESHIIWVSTEDISRMKRDEDRYLNRMNGNTAYVCYNDKIAYELMEIYSSHDISVPEDISIVSIDDADIAKRARVMLTTMKNPVRELGREAAAVILNTIKGAEVLMSYEAVPMLIERDSVRSKIS